MRKCRLRNIQQSETDLTDLVIIGGLPILMTSPCTYVHAQAIRPPHSRFEPELAMLPSPIWGGLALRNHSHPGCLHVTDHDIHSWCVDLIYMIVFDSHQPGAQQAARMAAELLGDVWHIHYLLQVQHRPLSTHNPAQAHMGATDGVVRQDCRRYQPSRAPHNGDGGKMRVTQTEHLLRQSCSASAVYKGSYTSTHTEEHLRTWRVSHHAEAASVVQDVRQLLLMTNTLTYDKYHC